jgi:hypothetical protein
VKFPRNWAAAPGPLQTFALAYETLREIRTAGARRSEIKGEPWAQPRVEDIRGGGHPVAPAGAMQERTRTNVRNGPQAALCATAPRSLRLAHSALAQLT